MPWRRWAVGLAVCLTLTTAQAAADIARLQTLLTEQRYTAAHADLAVQLAQVARVAEATFFSVSSSSRTRIDQLAEQEQLDAVRPELDGQQIMAILGIPPGPQVGRAYKFLLEMRLDEGAVGEDVARERLVSWAREKGVIDS